MSKNRIRLSDQIRRAVEAAGVSRYAIIKAAGIDKGVFSRFMAGKTGLALATLDDLADVLGLDIVANGPVRVLPPERRGRPKGSQSKPREAR